MNFMIKNRLKTQVKMLTIKKANCPDREHNVISLSWLARLPANELSDALNYFSESSCNESYSDRIKFLIESTLTHWKCVFFHRWIYFLIKERKIETRFRPDSGESGQNNVEFDFWLTAQRGNNDK